jgi:hypothetical protein
LTDWRCRRAHDATCSADPSWFHMHV